MTTSFYTGPGRPRLQAESWEQVVAASESGVLSETSWVELKESVPPSGSGANLEMAKDLASLSVDGGVLVIGVVDKTHVVVGTPLSGLADRVIQVAAGRVHPALHVEPLAVPHPSEPDFGLLVVAVPASADAPHMVDDRYWGRSAQGKRALTDPEVNRLFDQRRRRGSSLQADLQDMSSAFDPIAPNRREHGHLYMIVRPRGHVSGLLDAHIWSPSAMRRGASHARPSAALAA